MKQVHTIVIGGGPAGLAAAISARKHNVSVLLIEREEHLGGILKQCIHDGFGLKHFKERLTGPEYAKRFIDELESLDIEVRLSSTVLQIQKKENFLLDVLSQEGIERLSCTSLVLATGCRERTGKQISIHGQRPAGIYTAGSAQYFMNILGHLPTKRCVILGSGDIGLIMARRLRLEGAEVLGVYEAKAEPSGLTRNLLQCLQDYDIPLYLSHTVTRVFGDTRLNAVEITKVDEHMKPIPQTSFIVECDGLILSVGLIPENELAEKLSIPLDPRTKGPVVDQHFMSHLEGCFVCGNALHVNDLVDHVTHCALLAGKNAALYEKKPHYDQDIQVKTGLAYFIPQKLRYPLEDEKICCYFRVNKTMKKAKLKVYNEQDLLFEKVFTNLKPPEMENVEIESLRFKGVRAIKVEMEEIV